MFWFFIILYTVGVIAFPIWDAYIGTGVRWGEKSANGAGENPPAGCAALGWPILVPILILMHLSNQLDSVKEKRIKVEKERVRVQLLADKEQELALAQVEAELKQINRSK